MVISHYISGNKYLHKKFTGIFLLKLYQYRYVQIVETAEIRTAFITLRTKEIFFLNFRGKLTTYTLGLLEFELWKFVWYFYWLLKYWNFLIFRSVEFFLRDSPMRFSTSSFFHHLNQPGSLTNGLKHFWFWWSFRRVIWNFMNPPGYDTAQSQSPRGIIPQLVKWLF